MAEETQPQAAEPAPAAEAATEAEETKKPAEEAALAAAEADPAGAEAPAEEEAKPTEEFAAAAAAEAVAEEAGVTQSVSFKEESNIVADLQDPEKKALDELKQLIKAALANKEFTPPPPPPSPPAAAEEDPAKEEEKKMEEEAAKTEEPKTEEPKTEEPKTEEPKSEEPKTEEEARTEEEVVKIEEAKTEEASVSSPAAAEEEAASPPPAAEERPKADEPGPSAKEEEAPPLPAAAEVVVTEDKAVVVDEDGARNVEAIEETVVPVATPSEVTPPAEEPAASDVAAAEETPVAPAAETEATPEEPPEEVFLWRVPLLGDEKSDTILLKFLRARDFKVKDAMTMIKNAVIWRKQFGIDALVEEDLEIPELEKVVFNHGFDKEGHPVCYNVFGEFHNKELYAKAFGDEEKREKFLRWRIQFLEKGIRQQLDFTPGGVCSMVQVTDLKNTVGPGKKELRVATNKALTLLQDNYPEFLAKQVFINVPWWWLAYNRVISSIFTQRSKSKFVYAAPSKSAETLFKYIAPEQVPVQYGGLSKENDTHFTTVDAVTEVTIKPASKHTIEIPATEGCVLDWELRVLGWEVSYGAEFAPTAEDGYTVIIQKVRKFVSTDEPYVKNSFKIGEAGKVVLTISNATSKKKKLLYRYKEKGSTEST